MTGCRIGRFRLKSGGAWVSVLPQSNASETAQRLIRNARAISEYEGLSGYFVIGLFKDGTYSISFQIDEDGVIPPTLAPSYVADIVRRATATRAEIIDMFD